jgi:hypothetical protein
MASFKMNRGMTVMVGQSMATGDSKNPGYFKKGTLLMKQPTLSGIASGTPLSRKFRSLASMDSVALQAIREQATGKGVDENSLSDIDSEDEISFDIEDGNIRFSEVKTSFGALKRMSRLGKNSAEESEKLRRLIRDAKKYQLNKK